VGGGQQVLDEPIVDCVPSRFVEAEQRERPTSFDAHRLHGGRV
jgi:hypothetical protein